MRNMSSILTSHNKKILAENEKQYECNCRNKDECPLDNKCLTPRVIYEADNFDFTNKIEGRSNTEFIQPNYVNSLELVFFEKEIQIKYDMIGYLYFFLLILPS